jgi:hypothetical protein
VRLIQSQGTTVVSCLLPHRLSILVSVASRVQSKSASRQLSYVSYGVLRTMGPVAVSRLVYVLLLLDLFSLLDSRFFHSTYAKGVGLRAET